MQDPRVQRVGLRSSMLPATLSIPLMGASSRLTRPLRSILPFCNVRRPTGQHRRQWAYWRIRYIQLAMPQIAHMPPCSRPRVLTVQPHAGVCAPVIPVSGYSTCCTTTGPPGNGDEQCLRLTAPGSGSGSCAYRVGFNPSGTLAYSPPG